ncbi:hypothetical protein D3C86_1647280 [compost metagenome]
MATSDTSARVGMGLEIMDSIICVAVMTTLFSVRACWMMRFWMPTNSASPTSTPRSPRATITPSLARISESSASSSATASARSILAMIQAWLPASASKARASSMSLP